MLRAPLAGTTVVARLPAHGSFVIPGRHSQTVPAVSVSPDGEGLAGRHAVLTRARPVTRTSSSAGGRQRPCLGTTQPGCISPKYAGRVPRKSTRPYLFGDLLALARQSWVSQMARHLAAAGYPGYRRSDAAVMRVLRRGPASIGRLGTALGVTRQAARKVAGGLERRGYARFERDEGDARQVNVVLSDAGVGYAEAVVMVIDRLNRDLSGRVGRAQLAAADAVLRASLADDASRERAARVVAPP